MPISKLKRFVLALLFVVSCFKTSIIFSQVNTTTPSPANDTKTVTTALVDSVSKNGMNASIKNTRSLTSNATTAKSLENWLAINGEGLYNTKPWRIKAEGPSLSNATATYTATDFRFTQKGDVLYVYVMDIPQRDMIVKSLACTADNKPIKTITLLGSKEKISWEQHERGLTIEKPGTMPSENVIAFKLTFQEYLKAPALNAKIIDENKSAQ